MSEKPDYPNLGNPTIDVAKIKRYSLPCCNKHNRFKCNKSIKAYTTTRTRHRCYITFYHVLTQESFGETAAPNSNKNYALNLNIVDAYDDTYRK